ncbi:hypothetical protein BJV78DRAFT_1264734 [Lactifluus subvellereus]|nr:hypothetical protein BJV78DRAFT_1264734 [Lactifluus subvellereus]
MFAISTFVLVSALALCSTLTGVVRAAGPQGPQGQQGQQGQQPVCKGASPFSSTAASFHQVLANILLLTCRNGDTCTSIGQQFDVSQQALESMNPGINCKFSKALAYVH